jgi:hypothetical protein
MILALLTAYTNITVPLNDFNTINLSHQPKGAAIMRLTNPFSKKPAIEPSIPQHIGRPGLPTGQPSSRPAPTTRPHSPTGLAPRANAHAGGNMAPRASLSGASRANAQQIANQKQQAIAQRNGIAQHFQNTSKLNAESTQLGKDISTINSRLLGTNDPATRSKLTTLKHAKQAQLNAIEAEKASIRAGNPMQNLAAHVSPQAQRTPLTSFRPPNPAPFGLPQPPSNTIAPGRYQRAQPAQVAPFHRMAQNQVPQPVAQQHASPIKNSQLDLSALDLPAGYKSHGKQESMQKTPSSMSSISMMSEAQIDEEVAALLEAELDGPHISMSSPSMSTISSMSETEMDAELAELEAELDGDPDISAELDQLDAEVAQMRNSSHDKMDKALNKLGDQLNSLEDLTDLQAEQIEEKLDQQMDLVDMALEESYDNHALVSDAMNDALGLKDLDHDPEVNNILAELGIKTGPKTQADRNFDAMMKSLESR